MKKETEFITWLGWAEYNKREEKGFNYPGVSKQAVDFESES